MDSKIKVLHVVGRMDRGGTEALLMSLLRTLDTDKFQYDFVEQTEDECDYDKEIIDLGAKIYRCPHISVTNLTAYRKWWKLFLEEHPEYLIIHGHSRGSAPIYLDEAKKAGRITIAHCHSNSHGKGVKGAIRYIWQLPLRKIADYNFACSYGSGISQYGKNGKFEIIKNGIQSEKYMWNPDVCQRVRKELKIENKFVVGNVARFEEPKNHKFLIRIFKEIHQIRPDAVLMLVGQGTKEQEIHQLAKELGVENDIIYTGVRNDVNELLQAMDVFVFPSLYEGMPLALVEAQAAGLPCFTSDKVVTNEVKLTELLKFIPLERSPKEWAEMIIDGSIPVEKRQNTRQEIIDNGFDIQSTGEQLANFYVEVLENGR